MRSLNAKMILSCNSESLFCNTYTRMQYADCVFSQKKKEKKRKKICFLKRMKAAVFASQFLSSIQPDFFEINENSSTN